MVRNEYNPLGTSRSLRTQPGCVDGLVGWWVDGLMSWRVGGWVGGGNLGLSSGAPLKFTSTSSPAWLKALARPMRSSIKNVLRAMPAHIVPRLVLVGRLVRLAGSAGLVGLVGLVESVGLEGLVALAGVYKKAPSS